MPVPRRVQITAFTHQGKIRDCNEDAIAIGQWLRNAPMAEPHQWLLAFEEPVVCVVADGIGGHAAGEIASQYVAGRIGRELPCPDTPEHVRTLLQNINAEIYDQMSRDTSRIGMGTTIVGTVALGDKLIWFNVGDSRLYRHRNGFLRQISIDDVPSAVKQENPGLRRQTKVITQSLGGTKAVQPIEPHIGIEDLAVPSRWLLCSDGLTDMLSIDEMEACLAAPDPEAILRLIDGAMNAGGEDNISIVVLSFDEGEVPASMRSAFQEGA